MEPNKWEEGSFKVIQGKYIYILKILRNKNRKAETHLQFKDESVFKIHAV